MNTQSVGDTLSNARWGLAAQGAENFLKTLCDVGEDLQLQTARVLFYVASHEGCSVGDIAEAADMSYASASRNVAALSDWHRLRRPGLGLVEATEDPMERRRKRVVLTTKGKRTLSRLLKGWGK
jgi:DNA-binding MarR family transcriptional regulator